MKTTLRQHTELVNEIQKLNKIDAVRRLRSWLKEVGYEELEGCQHYAIVAKTGKCMQCGEQVTRPPILLETPWTLLDDE